MKRLIDPEKLEPGMIMQARTYNAFGRLIRNCLTRWIRRDLGPSAPAVWGSHTALVIEIDRQLYIGDSAPPFAHATPIPEWNEKVLAGKAEIRFFVVLGSTIEQGRAASTWWVLKVQGRVYDYMAFPRLLWKCMVKSWWKRAYGWKWAWFCTEGVGEAWAHACGAAVGPLGSVQATPLTVEKRAGFYGDKPTLKEVTDDVTFEHQEAG